MNSAAHRARPRAGSAWKTVARSPSAAVRSRPRARARRRRRIGRSRQGLTAMSLRPTGRVDALTLDVAPRRGARPARPQRRRQDHHDAPAQRRARRPTAARPRCSGSTRGPRRRRAPPPHRRAHRERRARRAVHRPREPRVRRRTLRGMPEAGGAERRGGELLERFGMGDRADVKVPGLLHRPAQAGGPRPGPPARPRAAVPRRAHLGPRPRRHPRRGRPDRLAWPPSEGRTVVLCTHFLGEAGRLADRMAVLFRGGCTPSARPAELAADAVARPRGATRPRRRRPRPSSWRSLLGLRGVLDARRPTRGVTVVVERPRRSCPPSSAALRRRRASASTASTPATADPRGRLLRHRGPGHRRPPRASSTAIACDDRRRRLAPARTPIGLGRRSGPSLVARPDRRPPVEGGHAADAAGARSCCS